MVACDDVDFSAAPVSPVALDNAKPLLFDDEARGVLPPLSRARVDRDVLSVSCRFTSTTTMLAAMAHTQCENRRLWTGDGMIGL